MRFTSSRIMGLVLAAAFSIGVAGCAPSALATGTTVSPHSPRPIVVAIGDSIMKGHGLAEKDAWPQMLATINKWSLTNLACDGAGFLKAGDPGDCGDDYSGLISKAVALHPNLVLISGSSNDLGISDQQLLAQTLQVVMTLRADLPKTVIVGISTVWNDTATPDQMNDINEQVRSAMKAVDGVYLDIGQPLAGHRSWLQGDDIHPTVAGQRQLAKVIAASIRAAKLTL